MQMHLLMNLKIWKKQLHGDSECMHLDYTKDVMDMMTEFQKSMEVHLSGRGIVCRNKKAHRYQLIISDIYVLLFVS